MPRLNFPRDLKTAPLVLVCLLLASRFAPGSTFTVLNVNDSGSGSLRQAILDANNNPGPDTITFRISGTGLRSIPLASGLPAILEEVVIDGTTQTGYGGKPLVELNGAKVGSYGLHVLAPNCLIRGLVLNRFGGQAILVEGEGTNRIVGNYIGTDANGTVARGNGQQGIGIFNSWGNIIGGTGAGEGNLICANSEAGIYLLQGGGHKVQGNSVGLTLAGVAMGNAKNGITVYNSASNLIGGAVSGAGNTISGNRESGVYLYGPGSIGNIIAGNTIGLNAAGGKVVSNAADGITVIGASANVIGGLETGSGNVLSGNGKAGVFLNDAGSSANLIIGNRIGTDKTGTLALGNSYSGISLLKASANFIGGPTEGAKNLISGNKQAGISISTNSNNNVVQGNWVGVDATGRKALSNAFDGIVLGACSNNIIGGGARSEGNLISGNGVYGVELGLGVRGTEMKGNWVGVDASGQTALGNGHSGLRIESVGNRVGGSRTTEANVLSGNQRYGVFLVGQAASGNFIQGNLIGTDATGGSAVGNRGSGVTISGAPGNLVGGPEGALGNVISGNGNAGVIIFGPTAQSNRIAGNLIGTDVTGTLPLGNSPEGLYATNTARNTIGGAESGEGNLISANLTRGIYFQNCSEMIIQGNRIGFKADGLQPLGNGAQGIEFDSGSKSNWVGGSSAGGNSIGNSSGIYCGVRIRDGCIGNAVIGNSILGNGSLAIDLGDFGPTLNDNCDGDAGANNLQNFPVLLGALGGQRVAIRGSLGSTANRAYTVQFYASAAADSSGYGEGEVFLGEQAVAIGAACTSEFRVVLDRPVPPGWVVAATATDSLGNTSEFSACIPVSGAPGLQVVPSAEGISLTWSGASAGFALKQARTLAAPVVWEAVSTIPVLRDGMYMVSLPQPTGTVFYTLAYE